MKTQITTIFKQGQTAGKNDVQSTFGLVATITTEKGEKFTADLRGQFTETAIMRIFGLTAEQMSELTEVQ